MRTLLVIALLFAAPVNAQTLLFSDNFESGALSQYTLGCPNANTISSTVVHGGTKSLKYDPVGTDTTGGCGVSFAPQQTVYLSMYIYLPSNFDTNCTFSGGKHMFRITYRVGSQYQVRQLDTGPASFNSCSTVKTIIDMLWGIETDYTANISTGMNLGAWNRLEILLHLNTNGLSDGYLKYWVNGALALDSTGKQFRNNSDPINALLITTNYDPPYSCSSCAHFWYLDDVALYDGCPTTGSCNVNPLVEPACPGGASPDPNIIFCDNFEDGNSNGWVLCCTCCYNDGHGTVATAASSAEPPVYPNPIIGPGMTLPGPCHVADCIGHKITYNGPQGFQDNYALWSNRYWVCCGNYVPETDFGVSPGYDEIHIRWYAYFGDACLDFSLSHYPCGGKHILYADSGLHMGGFVLAYAIGNAPGQLPAEPHVDQYSSQFYPCAGFPSGGDACSIRVQNLSPHLAIVSDQWYLFELHLKNNTLGTNNGTIEFWMDAVTPGVPLGHAQTLRLSFSDIAFQDTRTGTGKFRHIQLTPNNNYGYCRPGIDNRPGVNDNQGNNAYGIPGDPTGSTCSVDSQGNVIETQPSMYQKWDNIVVKLGNTMIGPMGAPSIQAPAQVQGVHTL